MDYATADQIWSAAYMRGFELCASEDMQEKHDAAGLAADRALTLKSVQTLMPRQIPISQLLHVQTAALSLSQAYELGYRDSSSQDPVARHRDGACTVLRMLADLGREVEENATAFEGRGTAEEHDKNELMALHAQTTN